MLLSTRNLQLAVASRKFADRYVGPFNVLERIGQVAYRLDLARSKLASLHNVFHVSLLRPYRDNGSSRRAPPLQVDDEGVEWEVGAIIGHRHHRQELQFLVTFTGFDASENRWMATGELGNCRDLLAAYRQQHGV